MTLKTILVPVEPGDSLEATLGTAVLTAKIFDGRITAQYVGANPPTVLVAGGDGLAAAAAADLAEGFQSQEQERAQASRQAFDAFIAKSGFEAARWLDDKPTGVEDLGRLARLYDLMVLGRPQRNLPAPSMAALEAVLFESGRPLLIAPPKAPETIGKTIVISWTRSTETARTVAFAAPFLERAEKVVVLELDDAQTPGPPASELASHLRCHDIAAESVERQARGRSPGIAILEEAAQVGCDLLVKGAYTSSRLRQMIFGGATRDILATAEIPVFMAH